MSKRVAGIFRDPWSANHGTKLRNNGGLTDLYRKGVRLKANPRGEDYMKALFLGRWPDGIYANTEQDSTWRELVRSADVVILLYPDALGLGLGALELELLRLARQGTDVGVLNGRKREFSLNYSSLPGLYLRRIMERGMLGEFLALFLFSITTPILLVLDWTRGHR